MSVPAKERARLRSFAVLEPLRRFPAGSGAITVLADVEVMAQEDGEGFHALGVVLSNAHFMDERVRKALGYPGQEARDSSTGLTAEDDALVSAVRSRGPVFRPA